MRGDGAPPDGLFNTVQARAAGLSKSALARRHAAGKLTRVLPEVHGINGAPPSRRRDLMAAILWAGDGSCASHRSAASLWSLDGFRIGPVEISTTRGRRPKGLPIRVHRVHPQLASEIVTVDGIPTTSPRRTLLDLAGAKDLRLESSLDQVLRTGLTDLGDIWLLCEQEHSRGRRGIAVFRELLAQRTPDLALTDSALESSLLDLLSSNGLAPTALQYPIALRWGVIHVDFAYPREELAIEVDGYASHMDRSAFERDRERDNALTALGWRVLRFTWAKVRWDPLYVIESVRSQLGVEWVLSGV